MDTETILRALVGNRLRSRIAHGYAFIAADKDERDEFVHDFIKVFLCEQIQDADDLPCGNCTECVRYESHPEVYALRVGDAESSSIGIAEVRRMLEGVMGRAQFAWRFVVIPSVSLLTREAETAMLKILEEPPAATTFVFLSDTADVLSPTLRSRLEVYMLTQTDGQLLREVKDFAALSPVEKMNKARELGADRQESIKFLKGLLRKIHDDVERARKKNNETDMVKNGTLLDISARSLHALESTQTNARLVLESLFARLL